MQYAGVNPSNSTGISGRAQLDESKVERKSNLRELVLSHFIVEPEADYELAVLDQISNEATMLYRRLPTTVSSEASQASHHRFITDRDFSASQN